MCSIPDILHLCRGQELSGMMDAGGSSWAVTRLIIPRSDSPGFELATFRVLGVRFTGAPEKNGCR
jgi:hypothetical protein